MAAPDKCDKIVHLAVKNRLFYIIFFVILLTFGASFCEDMSNEQRKLLDIQSELKSQKEKLKATKYEEQKALNNLAVIRKNLFKARKNLTEAKGKVGYNEKKIVELTRDRADAEKKIKLISRELRGRIVEVYKSGGASILEIIFSSRSMSDFINRSYYFGRVIRRDADLIGSLKEQIFTMRRTRTELETSNREIKGLVREIESEKVRISRSEAEKQISYQYLKNRRIEYERRVQQLEASSYEIERFIRGRKQTAAPGSGRLMYPIRGRLVSGFGYRRHPLWGGLHFHSGIDIAAPHGRPIVSADGGEVIFSGFWDGYGKAVVIDHGRGYTTVYGHMSRIYMQAGQNVEKGQVIGLVGSTGFSTGPHLHFEVRVDGRPVDPLKYLP